MITERLMLMGEFGLTLRVDTPPEIRDALVEFGHIVVFSSWIDPRLHNDAALLGMARYTGVLLERDDKGDDKTLRLDGAGLDWHLGDGDGKGFIFETAREYTTDTFADVLNRSGSTPYGLLRDDSGNTTAIEPGTINSIAGTYTGSHVYQSQRNAIRYVMDIMGAEYRINPDGTLDAGDQDDLFVTTPTAIVVRRDAGEDPNIDSVNVKTMIIGQSARDFTTRMLVLSSGIGDSEIVAGAANIGVNPYKDLHGNDLYRADVVSESETTEDNAAARASVLLGQNDEITKRMKLDVNDFDVEGTFSVGDTIYVYDPDSGLIDVTNAVRFRGRELNPTTIRVVGVSTPIRAGMGVSYRDANGNYTDITDWVVPETGAVKVEIGDFPETVTPHEKETIIAGRVYDEVEGINDTLFPNTPTKTGTPWGTASYQDGDGNTKAWVLVQWDEPTNTDSSSVTDGSHYIVRWRVSGQTEYQTGAVSWGTETFKIFDLAVDTNYEISVQAVDSNGNASAFAADETVLTSGDTAPPSTPAAPSVAGNPLRIQVTHQLGVSGGGTFNLEADLDHLNVYADTSAAFSIGDATFLGQIPATSAHLALGITVVGQFDMFSTTERYVKVTAVDISGNESSASSEVTVTAELIDTANIANLAVTTAIIDDLAVSNAKIASVSAAKLTAGTISAQLISVEGTGETGSNAIHINSTPSEAYIESDNYSAGSAGFRINTDGSAEFQDAIVRGTLNANDITAGTLAAARIATNSLSVDKISGGTYGNSDIVFSSGSDLESSNFSTGSTGWQIQGDGSAEFNDILIRGDIEASAWNGASPANLSSVDGSATAGFYLDSSVGSAQFEGDIFLGGDLTLEGGTVRTEASGQRIEMSSTNFSELQFYSGDADETSVARVEIDSVGTLQITGSVFTGSTSPASIVMFEGGGMRLSGGDDDWVELGALTGTHFRGSGATGAGLIPNTAGSNSAPAFAFNGDTDTGVYRSASNVLGLAAGGTEAVTVRAGGIRLVDGTVSAPAYTFIGDSNTGMYWHSSDTWALAAGGAITARGTSSGAVFFGSSATGKGVIQNNAAAPGNPTFTFQGDEDTGMYRAGTNNLQFATSGTARFGVSVADFQAPVIGDNTTGSAANTFIGTGGSHVMQRSTSGRHYKSQIDYDVIDELADYELKPARFWRDDDQRWWYGFIADDFTNQNPELGYFDDDGNPENYDDHEVMAIMAAKIVKLESLIET